MSAALAVGGYYSVRDRTDVTPTSVVAVPPTSTPTLSDSVAGPSTGVGATSTVPVRGGIVRVAVVGEPGTLNPLLTAGDRSLLALRHLVAASALRLDPVSHDLVAGVLTAVPTLGSGGLTVNQDGTMTVRAEISNEAFWSDGTAISGADFVRTFDVIMGHRDIIHPDILSSYDRVVPGSLVVTSNSIEFTLESVTLRLNDLFDVLVPAHQVTVRSFADDWNDTMWVSGGPFILERNSGQSLHFVANPAFASVDADGLALPYLDQLEVELFSTLDAAVEAFGSGSFDVVGSIDTDDLTSFVDQIDGVEIDVLRGPGWEQIAFQFGPGAENVNPQSVVDRGTIRRAILASIDRAAIASAVQGTYGEPIDSIAGIGWPAAREPIWGANTEPQGRLTGVTLVLAITGGDEDRMTIADLVTAQLGAAGATVQLVTDERGRFFGELVLPGEFEAAEWAWVSSPGPGNAAGDLLNWFTPDGDEALDFSEWSTAQDFGQFAALATGLGSLLSSEGLRQRLISAEQALADGVPLIPLFADLNVGAAWQRVHGYRHSALPGGVLATAAEWWLADE